MHRARITIAVAAVIAAGAGPAAGQCELQKITAENGAAGDVFGIALSDRGDVVVIGASSDDTAAPDAGAAYVYGRSGSTWSPVRQLLAFDAAAGDRYGAAVGIDGDTIFVGTPSNLNAVGAVYVYGKVGGAWTFEQKIEPPTNAGGQFFGELLAVQGDVLVVAAAAANAGAVAFVYRDTVGGWTLEQALGPATPTNFAYPVAIDGDVIAASISDPVLGNGSGGVRIYRFDGSSTWTLETLLLPSGGVAGTLFGRDGIDAEGELVVVGAWSDEAGSVYTFRFDAGAWSEEQRIEPPPGEPSSAFGWDVAVRDDLMLIGDPFNDGFAQDSGAAHVAEFDGGQWTITARLEASDAAAFQSLGLAVGLGADGVGMVTAFDDVAGFNAGAVYAFALAGADCNANGVIDPCDIVDGTSDDDDGDGVPDECGPTGGPTLIIKEDVCPADVNIAGNGILPAVLAGGDAFDVLAVDLATVALRRADGIGGTVPPLEGPAPGITMTIEDTTHGSATNDPCVCDADPTPDGHLDLSLRFAIDAAAEALGLGDEPLGSIVALEVTGALLDGMPFAAGDCIRLIAPGVPPGMIRLVGPTPDAWTEVTPLDDQLDGGGFGSFERTWPVGSEVTVGAPPALGGRPLEGWRLGDRTWSTTETTLVLVITERILEVEPIYGADLDPADGSPAAPSPRETGTSLGPQPGAR